MFESMLNRRILRIKVFKAIYCYAEDQGKTLRETEALLDSLCEASRDLCLFLLALVGPLTEEAFYRIEAARSKFNPTEEERNPNIRFVRNGITPLLTQDPDFTKITGKKKLSWDQYDVFLHNLYGKVRGRKYFRDYLEKEDYNGLEDDARLWSRIYERELEDNEELHGILEDLSIYWNDDLSYAIGCCRREFASLGSGERWKLPPLYRSEMEGGGRDNDRLFVYGVLRKAYNNFGTYFDRVAELTPKWNRDRICATDLALIVCGMAEAEAWPETSPKIIINEYVEIAKAYSTPESSAFVNGLLDKLINKH